MSSYEIVDTDLDSTLLGKYDFTRRRVVRLRIDQRLGNEPPPMSYAELEIGLSKLPTDDYEVQLRVSELDADSDVEIAPVRGVCKFAPEDLDLLVLEPDAYGKVLTDQLFEDPDTRAMFGRVRAVTESKGRDLRLRLFIDPSAAELHRLRWELLRDPDATDRPLATSERIIFSRFLASPDWRALRIRPRKKLAALVAVSAPTDLDDWSLAPVPFEAEARRAETSLAGVDNIATLGRGEDDPLTLDGLVEAIRRGVDIVYLVCHGVLKDSVPFLFLQDDSGKAARVHGGELALRVGELSEPPRLVVLASCESAGTEVAVGEDGTPLFTSLATRLSDAGVPAIVAMRGQHLHGEW